MTEQKEEFISPEDLRWLQESTATIQELKKQGDTLYSFTVGVLSKRYRLGEGDNLNGETGQITRKEAPKPTLVKEHKDA